MNFTVVYFGVDGAVAGQSYFATRSEAEDCDQDYRRMGISTSGVLGDGCNPICDEADAGFDLMAEYPESADCAAHVNAYYWATGEIPW